MTQHLPTTLVGKCLVVLGGLVVVVVGDVVIHRWIGGVGCAGSGFVNPKYKFEDAI